MFKRQTNRWWRAAVICCAAMTASPVQAGPIVDWFKNINSPPKPPCTARTCAAPGTCATPGACAVPGACGTAQPNTYYPGAPAPAAAGPIVVPGPVTYGAAPPAGARPGTVVQPGTVIQPNYSQPGYVQPGYGAPATIPPPATAFPNTVTPGPAYPPRTTNYAPPVTRATYYPTTAGTVVPASAMQPVGGAPVMVANQPAAYYAPAAPCPTCPQPAAPAIPRTVQFAPYTAYRTSWVQVPVTVYRPITAIDPATGRPVTVVQPCTATAWQAQRIPVSGQPFLSRYQPLPVSNPTGAVMAAPPAAVACPGGVCPVPAGTVGTGVPMVPGYSAAPPATSLPGTTLSPMPPPPASSPAMAAPPSQPSYLGAPARVAPGTPGGSPADIRPSLGPNEGSVPGAVNYPPQRDPYQSSPLNLPPPPYIPPQPSSTFPGASTPSTSAPNANLNRSASNPVNGAAPIEPATRLEPRVNVPTTTSPSGVTRPSTPAARPALPIKPLPDPDADSRDEVDRSVPRLIVPQERTAASRGAQPVHRVVPTPAPNPVRSATSSDKTWNDSGWTSSRP